jgi:hypothetical protein
MIINEILTIIIVVDFTGEIKGAAPSNRLDFLSSLHTKLSDRIIKSNLFKDWTVEAIDMLSTPFSEVRDLKFKILIIFYFLI